MLDTISELIPTGIFDNRTIERFLRKVLSRPGRSNDFRELNTMLRIVAVELDTGQAVRFGAPGHDHIPISRAVQASAALPGLYPPVSIEGHDYVDGALRRTLHASALLREGIDLLLDRLVRCLDLPCDSRERMLLLLPAYRVKWCCIMLNPLLPTGRDRRRFAGRDEQLDDLLHRVDAKLHDHSLDHTS